MFGSIGTYELFIILLVILIFFGGKQLPEIVRSITKGWYKFQKTNQSVTDEIRKVFEDDENFSG